jgi:hypothetical protein
MDMALTSPNSFLKRTAPGCNSKRKGRESAYRVGMPITIMFAKESDIFDYDQSSPFKSLADSYFLLKVEESR